MAPIICSTCDREFTARQNLYRHERTFHPRSDGGGENEVCAEDAVHASTVAVAAPSDEPPALKRPRCDDTVNDGPSTSKRPRCDEIVSDDTIFEHGQEVLECDACEAYFLTQEELDRHVKGHEIRREFRCMQCDRTYVKHDNLQLHIKSAHSAAGAPHMSRKRLLTQQHGGGEVRRDREFTQVETSVNNAARTYRLTFSKDMPGEDFVADLSSAVLVNAHERLEQLSREANIKWYTSLSLVFHKAARPDMITDPPVYFRTEPVQSTSATPLALQLKIALRRLWHKIDRYEANGSGRVIDHLRELDLHIVSYDPLGAGIYISLPQKLVGLRAILNIRNTGDNDW